MNNKEQLLKELLEQKRDELIWALAHQGYTQEDIAVIFFDLKDRSTISRIISRKPVDWKPKWVKQKSV